MLAVIDIFSKYGWFIPLKSKTVVEVANALQNIFKERKPEKLWVDKGKEFYNRDVQKLISLYHKYYSANSTKKYIDVLDELVKNYNNTAHSTIRMTPTEASKKENENKVWKNLYGDYNPPKRKTPKFSIGDNVRITKKKTLFEKGYARRWTEEVFTVSKVQYTDPLTYKIKDLKGEEITGTFYEQELQHTTQELFRIEKVVMKKGNKSLVKWYGFPDTFNSWVSNKDLIKL